MASTILADNGASSGSAGIKTSADSTGVLALQTTTAGGAATTAVTIGTDQSVTFAGNITLNNGAADGAQLSLSSSGYSNWNIDNYNGNFRWYYNATEYMRVDASGNLGIGTTSPVARVHARTGASSALSDSRYMVRAEGTSEAYLSAAGNDYVGVRFPSASSVSQAYIDYTHGTNHMSFGVNNAERARIDSSGNLTMRVGNLGTITNSPTTFVGFYGSQSNGQAATLGTIYGISPGSWGGALVFTTKSADSNPGDTQVERVRIDSIGNLLVGTTENSTSSGVGFKINANASAPNVGQVVNTAGNSNTYHFYNTNATNNGYRFYVNINGGVYNYSGNNSNLSDERTKTNIEVAGSYLEKICAIPVKLFNYKNEAEGEQRTLGVIAQDVEAVAPELVDQNGWLDESPEGEAPLKSVYTTDMMYALMKAIQEQQAIIQTLTSRIEALEAK